MLDSFLIRGLLIGLIFGVPAGAIGALTIQRTLAGGFWAGLITGLGSSAADILYACVGVFSITLISDFLTEHQRPISLLGGLLIILLGLRIFRQKAQTPGGTAVQRRLPLCFAGSFAVALTNPATILSFLVAFAAFEITGQQTAGQSVQLLVGILTGTACWWAVLSGVTALLRSHITERSSRLLNRILGCLMLLFGAAVLLRGVLYSN